MKEFVLLHDETFKCVRFNCFRYGWIVKRTFIVNRPLVRFHLYGEQSAMCKLEMIHFNTLSVTRVKREREREKEERKKENHFNFLYTITKGYSECKWMIIYLHHWFISLILSSKQLNGIFVWWSLLTLKHLQRYKQMIRVHFSTINLTRYRMRVLNKNTKRFATKWIQAKGRRKEVNERARNLFHCILVHL